MIKRCIAYGAAMLVILYTFLIYDAEVLSAILILSILYPILSLSWLTLTRKSLRTKRDRVPEMGEEGKEIRAGILLKNLSRYFAIQYEVKIAVTDRNREEKAVKICRGNLAPESSETVWCDFETTECGVLEVSVESIRRYDWFRIFYLTEEKEERSLIKIFPEYELIPMEITRRVREFQADDTEYAQDRKGDDASETYQIRSYREQDNIKDIHWKQTARAGKLMIRERGFPLGCVVLIWIDYPEGKKEKNDFSGMVKNAASLSVTLAEEKCIHLVAWYDDLTGKVVMWRVKTVQDACYMTWNLLDIHPYKRTDWMNECRMECFRGREFAAVIEVDASGRFWQNGQKAEHLRI